MSLRERLSQVWINYYTIFAVLLAFKIFLFRISLIHSITQAKAQTYTLCKSSEEYASYAASIPHYMLAHTNTYLAKTFTEAKNDALRAMKLSLTMTKNMIIFTINLTIGTYVCFFTSAVDISANVALNATESVISIANETTIKFANDLDNGLGNVSTIANKIISTINNAISSIKNLFNSSGNTDDMTNSIHSVNLTISSLRNWKIPSHINTEIEGLRAKVPDFNDVQTEMKKLINEPFDKVANKLNSTSISKLDADTFYVPGKRNIAFCKDSPKLDKLFEDAKSITTKSSYILMAIVIIIALTFIAYESWVTYRKWLTMEETTNNIVKYYRSCQSDPNFQYYVMAEIDALQNRPSAIITAYLAKLFYRRNPDNTNGINRLHWLINYMMSPYSLTVLLLGLLGLAGFVFQTIILVLLSHLKLDGLDDLVHNATAKLTEGLSDSVNEWCNKTNQDLLKYQNEINNHLLVNVKVATSSVNNTVSAFMTKMNTRIKEIFGNTPLYDPVQSVVGCVLSSKVDNIEKAMTWANKHAQVKFHQLNATEYIHQALNSTGDSRSGMKNRLLDVRTKMKNVMDDIIRTYKESLRIELYISLALIGLWMLTVVVGIAIMLYRNRKQFVLEKDFSDSSDSSGYTYPNNEKLYPTQEQKHSYYTGTGLINRTLASMLHKMKSTRRKPETQPQPQPQPTIMKAMRPPQDSISTLSSTYTDSGMSRAQMWHR